MVHVKDLVFKEDVELKFKSASVTHPVESERIVKSKIPGEGIIPWPGIIKKLKEMGFTGYLSLEYERRWYPQDLPPANEGMKKGLNYIRSIIEGKV
jgi:sugar phosphate isomerase/epimerase